ncbi:MAG: peroxiredoxin [Sphingobium sp.]
MRDLRIIVTAADAERFRGALVVAATAAALGGAAHLFLQLDAVALLRAPIAAPQDAAHKAAGLPTLGALLDDALSLGVAVTACQSGLALHAMEADALPVGIEIGGPVGFLQQTTDEARLIFA